MDKLMKDGKAVKFLAQGGIKFYPIQNNSDGSITVDNTKFGNKFVIEISESNYDKLSSSQKNNNQIWYHITS